MLEYLVEQNKRQPQSKKTQLRQTKSFVNGQKSADKLTTNYS